MGTIAMQQGPPALKSVSDKKFAIIATAMGSPSGDGIEVAVKDMAAATGLPTNLSETNVFRDVFDRIIAGALADLNYRANPINSNVADWLAMLKTSR